MGYSCPCGDSIGTAAHWCEWRQEVHARRVEALLERLLLAILTGELLAERPATAVLEEVRASALASAMAGPGELEGVRP